MQRVEMAEVQPLQLTPGQVSVLEKLLRAGFKFLTLERMEKYLAVEKDSFMALLDPGEGKIRMFGQAGYRMGEGIGMLVEREGGKAFVWHGESVAASPKLLAAYHRFKTELKELVKGEAQEAEGRRE